MLASIVNFIFLLCFILLPFFFMTAITGYFLSGKYKRAIIVIPVSLLLMQMSLIYFLVGLYDFFVFVNMNLLVYMIALLVNMLIICAIYMSKKPYSRHLYIIPFVITILWVVIYLYH